MIAEDPPRDLPRGHKHLLIKNNNLKLNCTFYEVSSVPVILDAGTGQVALRCRLVLPIHIRKLKESGQYGKLSHYSLIFTSFDKQDVPVFVFRQSIGDDRAGRSSPDDDEIIVNLDVLTNKATIRRILLEKHFSLLND